MAPSGSKDVTEKKAGQARQSCLGKVIIVAFEFQSVQRPGVAFLEDSLLAISITLE